jgi:AraC-like DNA-binding protein
MHSSINIRDLYNPLQPTVKQSAENVTYSEFAPDYKLQQFIYCYWQLRTTNQLTEQFNYRVVADGCVDIFFELDQPHESFVMGFCKKFTEFPLSNSFNYVGIRFLPTMFPQLFNINAKELSNRFEDLRSVLPSVAQFIRNNLHAAMDAVQITQLFNNYFQQHITTVEFNNDNRLYEALELILNSQGMHTVENGLTNGISTRQLRRLFEFYIGDTPKVFSQVVRFQAILKAKPSSQSLRQNKLFFDAGYYDQSHFIREFKNFYGVTPAKAFGR